MTDNQTQQAQTSPPAPQQTAPAAPKTPVEQDDKFFAALGYFGPLFVVPLIVKPKSAFCKFHAKQSMVMFLVAIFALVVLVSVPWFGSLCTLALFALYILAIYRAYMGDLWNIPVISTFAGKMNVDALYEKAGLAVSTISGLKEKAGTLAEKAGEAAKGLGKQEEAPHEPEQPTPTPPAPPAEQKK